MIFLSTGTLNTLGIARIFALAAEAGFDGIEMMIDARLDTRDAAYIRRLSAEHGLPVPVLHSPFLPDVSGWPTDQLGRLQYTLALAQELGARFVVSHLPYRLYPMTFTWGGPKPWRFSAPVPRQWRGPYYDLLRDGGLASLEAETGVTIGIENMPARRFLRRTFDLYWFNGADELRRFPHLTLDTTHLGTWGLNPVEVYEHVKDRVRHVHLSNFSNGVEHRTPEDGQLDLRAFLRALSQNHYDGTISVEGGPDSYYAEDETRCRAELRRALAFCRENLA